MPAALAVAPGLAVLPVLGNGFVDWDGTRSSLANPRYRGLGWAQPRGVATEAHYDPPGVARDFEGPARHGPELAVLRRLRPDLATIAARRAS
jgi:hypothetical protein